MSASVSVVIPAHNSARFLADAIDSVRAQTFPIAELFVVDDGSTDETAAIAESLQATVCRAPLRRGVSAARNHAIGHTSGDLIALLDADDTWRSNKLERQVAAFNEHPESELCTTHFAYFLHPGVSPLPTLDSSILGKAQPKTCPSTWLIKRSLFDRVGWFSEELQVAEDIAWLSHANTRGVATQALEECLVDKRIHDSNISGNFRETYRHTFAALRASLGERRGGPSK
ncbi:MAG: glycosyltransferase family 2 protein [Tepidiformaceae bacterium]